MHVPGRFAASVLLLSVWIALAFVPPSAAEHGASDNSAPATGSQEGEAARIPIAVLPFRIHSARPLGYLTESLSDLLATRLESTGKVDVLESHVVSEALGGSTRAEFSEEELRKLAERLGVRVVISGSITELAGRFSLDIRLTPVGTGRSQSIAIIASSEEDLIGRLSELADRSVASLSGTDPDMITVVTFEAAGEIEGELRATLEYTAGTIYEPAEVRRDRAKIEAHPGVARVKLDVERGPEGIELVYRVIRSERLFGSAAREREGANIGAIVIRGHRRIEADTILSRITSQVDAPLNEDDVARDIRSVFELGFFGDVKAFVDDGERGKVLIFEVVENPVVRQISISGNDKIDGDDIKEILTLTTGSTLDRSLLKANTERIKALYRAQGYYLAQAGFEIENITEGSVTVHFEVEENEKQRLKKVEFEGNHAFSDRELRGDFVTKLWRPWSLLTSWFDKSGTYAEQVFMRDLRAIEKKYSDIGYLQVELAEPEIDVSEDGLAIRVAIREGPQFSVGEINITGDESMDFEALLDKLKLETGEIFNRSHLTEDVEILERHYTDRGFYFASVRPGTRLDTETRKIHVEFQVKKGPLYFIRHINLFGNTITVDTGRVRFSVLKQGFNLFNDLYYDANGDGQYAASERIIEPGASEGPVFTGRLAGDIQRARDRDNISVVIEEAGPFRVVLRIESLGRFTSTSDHEHGFAVRIYAYAGMSIVKVDYQLQNSAKNVMYSWPLYFEDVSLNVRTTLTDPVVSFGMDTGRSWAGSEGRYLFQSSLSDATVRTSSGSLVERATTKDKGQPMYGWADVTKGAMGMAVMVRHMAEM
ncbi:MAG: hypothetical protein IH973_03030, partial [Myxococcales bacterium]|nr:hypothetical protein [Myxococcales bacterium]